MTQRILVTGAAGCIGLHLVRHLTTQGFWVRGVDSRITQSISTAADEFVVADLRRYEDCLAVTYDIDKIFHLAADTGGVHYRATNTAAPVRNNTLMNLNILEASRTHRVGRILFASSTAVYPANSQQNFITQPIAEEEAAFAAPQDSVGWEKLFAEQVCKYYQKDFGLDIRLARLQGVYGPHTPYEGGQEMALAALCRDMACARDGDPIVIWGDGKQSRSYLYVTDCVDALTRIMDSEQTVAFNVGSEESITINDLVTEIAAVAGKSVVKRNDPSRYQGVRTRHIDTTRLREVLAWKPAVTLRAGLAQTYEWIESDILRGPPDSLAPRTSARKGAVRVRAISRSASTVAGTNRVPVVKKSA